MVSMLAARSLLTLVTAILSCLPGVLLCRGCRLRSQLTWGHSLVNNNTSKYTGLFFYCDLGSGLVNQLYYGVFSCFCTFCIAKYGRTFI